MNRKPPILHALAGTHRPSRHGEKVSLPNTDTEPPAPPDFLNADALKVWHELAPALTRLGLLNSLNKAFFGHYCALDTTLRAAWSRGTAPNGAQLAQHRHYARDLGLIDLRLPAGGGSKANRFSGNGKRPAG